MEIFLTIMFVAAALLVLGFVYRIVRYDDARGTKFGAKISNTLGEVNCRCSGMKHFSIMVHALDGKSQGKAAGIDLKNHFFSNEHATIALSIDETKELVELLNSAISET